MSFRKTALVLSDNYLVREGLKALLNDCGMYEELFVATDALKFEGLLLKTSPSIVIVDLQSEEFRVEKVLAFVDFTTKSNIVLFGNKLTKTECNQFLERGAKGVLLKSSSKEVLCQALQEVEDGNQFLDEGISEQSPESISMIEQLNISSREKEIIGLIARGLINKEIADRLFISTHTVNTHRKNIMAKLGINNTAGIVLFAVKEGIVSPNEFLFL